MILKFRYLLIVAIAFFIVGAFLFRTDNLVLGQNSSVNVLNPWKIVSGVITPRNDTNGLKIDSLGSANECLVTDADGVVSTATCGAGGSSEHTDAGAYVYPNEGDYHSSPYYVATSTTASTFTYASTTGVSATTFWGNLIGNVTGALTGNVTGTASLATALAGNGSNCSAGSFPLGVDASGAVETCTDAWTEAENTSAAYISAGALTPYLTLSAFYSTTTQDIAESGNLYYTDARVGTYIHSSTTIPKTYTANTFTGLQTISNASTTHLSVSGSSYLGTVRSGTWNGTALADAYVADDITASSYLSLTSWYATTSHSKISTLQGLASIGSSSATTTAPGYLAASAFGIAAKWFADATHFIVQIAAQFTAGLTVLDFLDIPSAANPTVDAEGEIAINTTAASSSLRYFDGTAERVLSPVVERSFSFASTTLDYMGDFGAAGTTTILLMNSDRPVTVTDIYCKTNTGTSSIQFSDGTNKTDELRCGPNGTEDDGTIANSTWTRREDFKIDIGSSVGSPSNITVTAGIRNDAD